MTETESCETLTTASLPKAVFYCHSSGDTDQEKQPLVPPCFGQEMIFVSLSAFSNNNGMITKDGYFED